MWLDRLEIIWKELRKKPIEFLAIDVAQGIGKIIYLEKIRDHWKVYKYRVKLLPFSENPDARPFVQFVQDFIQENGIAAQDVILSISDADSLGVACLPAPDLP
ncbi:MAG TPA: hypothetical protein PK470_01730, partial [Candidatus Omnitrophota bacterium]|nr:hypothetical protein [Candidatus Omnitrophota bacterium]